MLVSADAGSPPKPATSEAEMEVGCVSIWLVSAGVDLGVVIVVLNERRDEQGN